LTHCHIAELKSPRETFPLQFGRCYGTSYSLKMSSRDGKKRNFSLIELMICVAVLSIAASITIPSYMNQVFHNRQEECLRQLRAIQAAEQEYFKKYGRYTNDLKELGWQPDAKPLYLYGLRHAPEGVIATSINPVALCDPEQLECYSTILMQHSNGQILTLQDLPETHFDAATGFQFACVGNIDSDRELDRITIDQSGQIVRVTQDLD